jgi:hypothetical protein
VLIFILWRSVRKTTIILVWKNYDFSRQYTFKIQLALQLQRFCLIGKPNMLFPSFLNRFSYYMNLWWCLWSFSVDIFNICSLAPGYQNHNFGYENIMILVDNMPLIENTLNKFSIKGILSTKIIMFSYPKLLSFSVLTFIKWRLSTELLANTQRNVAKILLDR